MPRRKLSNLLEDFEREHFPTPNIPYTNQKEYMKEYMKRYRVLALKMIAGYNPIVCSGCGCNEISFLEINHKDGNGNSDEDYCNGNTGKPKRRTIQFYIDIARGKRSIADLDIRCKVCNSLEVLRKKNPEKASRFKVIW